MSFYHWVDGLIVLICFLGLAGVSLIWDYLASLINETKEEKKKKRRK